MSRSTSLEKRAKEVILMQMEELGEVTTENVIELIKPHFIFDVSKAREQAIRRKANSLMAQFKDDKGIRTCFNYKDDEGKSKYINVDVAKDIKALTKIEEQLNKKYYGLNESKKKISKRRAELIGQMTFGEVAAGKEV